MLTDVRRVLVQALLAEDPCAALRTALDARPDALTEEEKGFLLGIDPDGLRMTGLIMRKLRFERLLAGVPELRGKSEEMPDSFIEIFRRYHGQVPPRTFFPQEEADAYRAFCR